MATTLPKLRLRGAIVVLFTIDACTARPDAAARRDSTASDSTWSRALADTLEQFGAEDQKGRDGLARAAAAHDTLAMRASLRADSAHSLWLRRAVHDRGWPSPASVGDRAAQSAWLILQHSPFYDWQSEMLPTLEAAAARGDVARSDLALFTDRVLVHAGKPQRYGSQFDVANGQLVASPIEDPAHLDSLRATMSLPAMRDYVKMLGDLYKLPVVWPPAAANAATPASKPLSADAFTRAEGAILRLPPSSFPALPARIRADLDRRNCRVPQTFVTNSPHNVISGEFRTVKAKDWAILCSVGGRSQVLVYAAAGASAADSLGEGADKTFLQDVGGGRIGYSRVINTVDVDRIRSTPAAVRDRLAIDHEGIELAFIGKASSIYYNNRGRWIELGGSD